MVRLTHRRPWRRHLTGRVALLMAGTVCLMLVLGPVPTLAAPSVSEPADPVPAGAAGLAASGACLAVSDLLVPPVDTGLELVPPPTGCPPGTSGTSGTSGGHPVGGGTITDADGTSYQCGARRGFNDACPGMVSVPYGPGGDPQGQYRMEPAETLTSPDGDTVYVAGAEAVPAAAGFQYNAVVVAYDADTGAFRWTRVIEPVAPHTKAFAQGASISHDGARLYIQGMMSSDTTKDAYAAALDTATGDVIWQKPLTAMLDVPAASLSDSTGGIGVSPDDTRIYLADRVVQIGSLPFDLNTDATPWYLALDAASGDLIWATEYTPQASQSASTNSLVSPTLALTPDGSRVVAQASLYGPEGIAGFTMLVFDAATGAQQWAHEELYGEGRQNPPKGLVLSPGGETVYAVYNPRHYNAAGEVEHGNWAVKAWDTTTGQVEWTHEHEDTAWKPVTGCDTPTYIFGMYSSLATSPSGDTLYVLGRVGTPTSDCYPEQTGVLALDATTGEPEWAAAYDGDGGGYAVGGCVLDCWEIVTAPGPGGGDAGSTVYVALAFYPLDAIPSAACGGRVPCLSYGMTVGFDGRTGKVTKQLRWIDTFYEPPRNDTDGGGAFNNSWGGAALSPDGTRLHVAQWVSSRPRDWKGVLQVLSYDTRSR